MFSYFVIHVVNELGVELLRKEMYSQPQVAHKLALSI